MMKFDTNKLMEMLQQVLDQDGNVPNSNPFHRKNTNLRKQGIIWEMTNDERQEYIKVASDVRYFANKFGFLPDSHQGLGVMLEALSDLSKRTIWSMSRSWGQHHAISTYLCWKILFSNDYNVMVCSSDRERSRSLLDQVRQKYSTIPFYLKPGITKLNKDNLIVENGSSISSVPLTKSSTDYSSDLLILRDFDYWSTKQVNDVMTSFGLSVSDRGKMLIVSTAKSEDHSPMKLLYSEMDHNDYDRYDFRHWGWDMIGFTDQQLHKYRSDGDRYSDGGWMDET